MSRLVLCGSSLKNQQRNERIFNIMTYILVAFVFICGFSLLFDYFDWNNVDDGHYNDKISFDLNRVREVVLPTDAEEAHARNPNCRFWDCLNLYRCGQSGHERLTVYVYPLREYVDAGSGKLAAPLTREYYKILETVLHSPYYTSNPNEACLFLPSIDMLNQNLIDTGLVGRALMSLNHWEAGENHLIFNMLPGSYPVFNRVIDVNTDRAVILGGGFDLMTFRTGFDLSLPVWNPSLENFDSNKLNNKFERKYLLVVGQLNVLPENGRVLQTLEQHNPKEILVLHMCTDSQHTNNKNLHLRCSAKDSKNVKTYDYPNVLSTGVFCLISRSLRLGQPDLVEMLAHNCIPVIAVDNYVMPFEDVLDWTLSSIRIRESELHALMQKLQAVSHTKIHEMQQQIRWLYNRYFKDLQTITLTALEILEERIFPHRSKSLAHWNTVDTNYRAAFNPLFLPLIAPKSQGFTAVILTYDRVESLFTLIQKLALVPSLQSILVIWNNQKKSPPHLSKFPNIPKSLKIIQTRYNKLSNRFFPYEEIETEAVLTIDDDIIMLTSDELDFGFEVWREFPDRIVGFPSRIHVWDNSTKRWHYESEWTNQISMVLTGAAFHHKFWNHMYTYSMPGDIKDWVDEHMNCEDIAMNFLVANITNKPPVKVTPRKKFKCPECTNTEMLSADLDHMRERSACINRFTRIYGHMPLRSVEFRADPVLFKDNFPEKLKRFNDVGIL